MPAYSWPNDPVEIIRSFEIRHQNPDAGALLLFAVWAVDSLHYLANLDRAHDLSASTIDDHHPDVVEVAHVRWATGTSITALDLCAAGLGRALCAHIGPRELDIGDFDPATPSKPIVRLRGLLPLDARLWVDALYADPRYKQIVAARHSLTHARLTRHFAVPRQRLRLQVENDALDVPTLIDYARDVGTRHVSTLLAIVPGL